MTRIGPGGNGSGRLPDPPADRRDRAERDAFRDPRRESGQNAFGAPRDGAPRRDGGGDRLRGRSTETGGRGDGPREGRAGEAGSEWSFQRLLDERAGGRDGTGQGGSDDGRDADLLADTEGAVQPAGLAPAVFDPHVAPAEPAAARNDERAAGTDHVLALAERIGDALRLDRLVQARGEGTFRLVGDAAGGLEAVTVSLTGSSLDVTLVGAFTGAHADVAGAAAMLAGELGARFPGRRVRVFGGRDRDGDGPPGDGLSSIGRWLARS